METTFTVPMRLIMLQLEGSWRRQVFFIIFMGMKSWQDANVCLYVFNIWYVSSLVLGNIFMVVVCLLII